MTKIFNFGLPKTGLSSFRALTESLGHDSRGRIYEMAQCYYQRDMASLKQGYDEKGDVFCDIPTPFMYKALWASYGTDAKYVLTLRRDDELWYQSLLRHNIYAHPFRHKHGRWFRYHYPHGFETEHRDFYRRHNQAVMDFFATHAPAHFVTVNIDTENAIEKLRPLLAIPEDVTAFPRRNISGTRKEKLFDRFKRNYNRVAQPLYGAVAPKIVKRAPIEPFYPDQFE